jgi:hypothetical protein
LDPKPGGIRTSPDRVFTGPLAAIPRQRRAPCVAREGPSAASAPDWHGREKGILLVVAEEGLDLCGGFNTA